jgi:hypothetical protein
LSNPNFEAKFSLVIFLIVCNFSSIAQISYNELHNLDSLCKSKEFSSARSLLDKKNSKIVFLKTNYEQDNHLVFVHLLAKYNVRIKEDIEVDFSEYKDYSLLKTHQNLKGKISDFDSLLRINPIQHWIDENWGEALVSKIIKGTLETKLIGKNCSLYLIDSNTTKIPNNDLKSFTAEQINNSEIGFSSSFLNSNPLIGEIKYYTISYKTKKEEFEFAIDMTTLIPK